MLDPPNTVIIASGVGSSGSEEDALGSYDVIKVKKAADIPSAITRDTACVIIPNDADVEGLIEDIRARDPDLPVLISIDTEGFSLEDRPATIPGVKYVPRLLDGDHTDIVDRAIAEYRRHRRERADSAILDAMFDELPYALYVKDTEARHVRNNTVTRETEGRILGRTDLEAPDSPDRSHARRAYEDDREVLDSGEPIIEKRERVDLDEHTLWFETSKIPWFLDGDIRGLVGITNDITDYRELELETARKRARHRRIAEYIAHEIRNPLTLAEGMLSHARESGDVDALDTAQEALDRIDAVVENMRTVTTDDEAVAATLATTPLYEAVQEAWELLDTQDATLEVAVPLDATILASQSELRELLENLFRNAIEHGGDSVCVSVHTHSDGFIVEDDGVGFSEDVSELMEYGQTTSESGSGYGLAIVSEIASLYGWSVDPSSSADGGARFEISNCMVVETPPPTHFEDTAELDDDIDIGDAIPAGSATRNAGDAWTIVGGGDNIWRDTNEHHFTYTEIEEDVRLEASVTELDAVTEWTKAGVMIRTGLEETASFGFIGMTGAHGSEIIWRTHPAELTRTRQFYEACEVPCSYRISWADGVLTVSISEDGEAWLPVDQRSITTDASLYAGLAVCSCDRTQVASAQFEEVRIECG